MPIHAIDLDKIIGILEQRESEIFYIVSANVIIDTIKEKYLQCCVNCKEYYNIGRCKSLYKYIYI